MVCLLNYVGLENGQKVEFCSKMHLKVNSKSANFSISNSEIELGIYRTDFPLLFHPLKLMVTFVNPTVYIEFCS